ncbi:MAG: ABC transporter permease [Eubacteriales bacterium]|jgi:putative ABC transport system permease protein
MIGQSVKMAWKSITSHKMRSFLTMLGIIIGVFALVVLVSLVNGASGTITDTVNSLGTNMLTVTVTDDHSRPIRMADLSEIEALDAVHEAAPDVTAQATATGAHGTKNIMVTGTTPSYADIQNTKLDSGRFLMNPDIDNHSSVVVINSDLATDVMGRTDVTGETIRLNGRNFLIIGVEEKSQNGAMMGALTGQYAAYIPYPSMVRITEGADYTISSLLISADNDDTDAAEDSVKAYLNSRFDGDDDAYSLFNMSQIADSMDTVMHTLSLLLGGIAAISLLVGGIGIMNIMLVSVTERTKEIGIRKAIGASRKTIMLQFLIESLMLSLFGCAFGILLSWMGLMVIDVIGNVTYGLSGGVVTVAIVFSTAVGLIFGLYPANKAAKKKPIDALRTE